MHDHLLCSVALAEVGLDFSTITSDSEAVDNQWVALREQLKLARDLHLPVSIHVHDRMFKEDAQEQCLEILSDILAS